MSTRKTHRAVKMPQNVHMQGIRLDSRRLHPKRHPPARLVRGGGGGQLRRLRCGAPPGSANPLALPLLGGARAA